MPPLLRRAARSVHVLALALLGLASTQCVASRPWLRTPRRELEVPVEGHQLAYGNGLSLLVVPDLQTRAIQFDVRHHVGSRDDPPGKAQLAHLVEHLMFELPTAGPGSPSLLVEAEASTLAVNAYTSADETHYMMTGLPEQLETYVRHATRRLTFDCAEIDDATLAHAREIVKNELRWRQEGIDGVQAELRAQVLEAVFPAEHPYRSRTHVELDEMAALTREDVCGFVERHYVPARTTVVVSGNVTPEEVKALTDAQLSGLPTVETAPRAVVPAVEPTARRVTIEAAVDDAAGLVLFPMPTRFAPEHIPARVAIEAVLGAVAVTATRRDTAIEDWDIVELGGKETPIFGVVVSAKDPELLERAFDELLDAIYAVFALEFSDSAFDNVRQLRRLRVIEGVADLSTRSRVYADYLEEGDAATFVAGELAALDELVPDRIRRVGRSVFSPDHAITVAIVPTAATKDQSRADRVELAPDAVPEPFVGTTAARLPVDIDAADAQRPLEIEDVEPPDLEMQVTTLRNGMRVVLVESSQFPIMEARLIYGAGTLHTPEQPLVAALADSTYGLRDSEALDLLRLFDLAGGRLTGEVGPRSTEFRARGLSIYLDFLIAGLAEAHAHDTYSEELFAKQKALAIEIAKDERIELLLGLGRAYGAALYGEGHPYGGSQGDAESLRPRAVRRFHRTHYRAANSTLLITGGFDMGLALEHVRGAFESPRDVPSWSTWHSVAMTPTDLEVPALRTDYGRVITRVVEGKTQTQVTLGFAVPEVMGYDHAGLEVLTTMLEHEVAAVRETLGASYGVHARLHLDWPRVEISGELDSSRAGPALAEIRSAIDRVFDPATFDLRFVHARRQVLRELLGAQGDPQGFGLQIATALRYGQPSNYFSKLARSVAGLTADELRTNYSSWLAVDKAVMLIQGPAAGIEQATQHNGLTYVRELPPLLRKKREKATE